MAASDLVAVFVQQCLVLESTRAKLNAVIEIKQSLESTSQSGCEDEWREFVEGQPLPHEIDEFNDKNSASDFMLRDSLIECLIKNCHHTLADSAVEDDESEVVSELTACSFLCLSYLVNLRCTEKSRGNKYANIPPIFGSEFVMYIAPYVVDALKVEEVLTSYHVACAASKLLIALLRHDRPRNEIDLTAIRDSILIPASSGADKDSLGSVACICEVLSFSVASAVTSAVPSTDFIDVEELTMRRETATLTKVQCFREVFENIGNACFRCLTDRNFDNGSCGQRIMRALKELHTVAPYAVESQLEALLDDRALVIVSCLVEGSANDNDQQMEEGEKDNRGEKREECSIIAPLYANITNPPIILSSLKDLDIVMKHIAERLHQIGSESWYERMAALTDIELILAGGVVSLGSEIRHFFIDHLRKMPINDQFIDLRSQITQQASLVVIAISYEFRKYATVDSALWMSISNFVESCVPYVLRLCMSGTPLMATQGMNCLLCLAAVSGDIGHPRTIPMFCEDVIDKKVHKNRKRGSLMALTAALRAWKSCCFGKYVEKIAKAAELAMSNRDPGVREEGRKLYWAMYACEVTSKAAVDLFTPSSRDMKTLRNIKEEVDSDWDIGGKMIHLVQTGVLDQERSVEPVIKGEAMRNGQNMRVQPSRLINPLRSSLKRPASAGLKAEGGIPTKNGRFSTPTRLPSMTYTSPKYSNTSLSTLNNMHNSPISFSGRKTASEISSRISPSKITCRDRRDNIEIKSDILLTCEVNPNKFIQGDKENTHVFNQKEGDEGSLDIAHQKKSDGVMKNSTPPTFGTPITALLARPSPISIEKVRNPDDVLGEVISMISDTSSRHEQFLGIQALAFFASEQSTHESWEEKFPLVLKILIGQIKSSRTDDRYECIDFIRSPANKLGSRNEAQHMLLQGMRTLLQRVPSHIDDYQIKDIMCCLLECSDAPFEIVHTSERALQNLVTLTNHETCFQCLMSFTLDVEIDLKDKFNPPVLLSVLRTMKHVIEFISVDSLTQALPGLMKLLQSTLKHKSVDMRKATVLLIVEMYLILGDDLCLSGFTESQQRLIEVYINKHPKKPQQSLLH